MKRLLITALILSGLIGAQGQTLEFKNSRKILLEGQKQSKEEVFKIMENHSEALYLYKKGKSLRTWGDVTFFGGLGIAIGGVLLNSLANVGSINKPIKNIGYYNGYNSGTYTETDYTLSIVSLAVGGGLLAATIPLKIIGKKKIKQSVDLYNADLQSASDIQPDKSSLVYNFTFINNNRGLGFRLAF
jgi:hypothetical protein